MFVNVVFLASTENRLYCKQDYVNLIMLINIDSLSLDSFDAEKFVPDWIESTVTSRYLAIIHLEQKNLKKLIKMLLFYKEKTK